MENLDNNYAITTFCYGERYYEQTNRLIDSFKELSFLNLILLLKIFTAGPLQ